MAYIQQLAECSAQKDSVLYLPCHSMAGDGSRAEAIFMKSGFRDWNHATGREGILQRHAKCLTHLHATIAWHTQQS